MGPRAAGLVATAEPGKCESGASQNGVEAQSAFRLPTLRASFFPVHLSFFSSPFMCLNEV